MEKQETENKREPNRKFMLGKLTKFGFQNQSMLKPDPTNECIRNQNKSLFLIKIIQFKFSQKILFPKNLKENILNVVIWKVIFCN